MSSTGNRIQARREELDLTREELAKKLTSLGVKTTRLKVWRIETGAVKLPADDLKPWAKALKTTAAELLP